MPEPAAKGGAAFALSRGHEANSDIFVFSGNPFDFASGVVEVLVRC